MMRADDFAPFERLLTDLRAAEPASFPRASDDVSILYTSAYRLECKHAMRAWVNLNLCDLPADKSHLAHGIVYQAAKAELCRPLRSPEHRLLSEATRDWIVAREAMQAAGAQR